MDLRALPAASSWTHRDARVGFEALFADPGRGSARVPATFDFECELVFDASGLVVGYPGIATRDR